MTLPGYFVPQQWFVAQLQLLPHEKISLKNAAQVKLHTGTSEVTANVYLLEANRLEAGGQCFAQFYSSGPLVAGPGDHFIVRSLSPVRTIGGGIIVEGLDRKLKRTVRGLIDDLQIRREVLPDTQRFVEYAVRTAGPYMASDMELAVRTKMRPETVRKNLATLIEKNVVQSVAPGTYIHRNTLSELSQRVVGAIGQFHEESPTRIGIPLDQLRELVKFERPLLDYVLLTAQRDGRISEQKGYWAAAGHRAKFSDEDAARLDAIETLFQQRLFRPPGVDEICESLDIQANDVKRLLRILREHGHLVRVEGDILFHHDAIDAVRHKLVAFIRKEGRLESVKFKYLLDTSRRFAIPMLDYLDTLGITRRDGHTRYLKEP